MSELKNKSTILIIVALIVICGGSFIGIRALSSNADVQTTTNITYATEPTTTTTTTTMPYSTTQQPVADMNLNLPSTNLAATTNAAPLTTSSSNLITTFPMVPGATTTTATTTTATTIATTADITLPTLPTTTRNLTNATAANSNSSSLKDKGLAGYLFSSNGNFFFTSDDPWQRNFGYNQAFDTAAPFVSIYMDTLRLKFRYDNKDWMIQLWKGQYGLAFVGAEIGVYTKPLDREVDHYDAASDEDALYMSMTGYRDDQVIFSREYTKYWWCTGFVPGQLKKFSDRSELAVKCRITAKDEEMLSSIVSQLKANNLVDGRHFTVSDLDVFITWQ